MAERGAAILPSNTPFRITNNHDAENGRLSAPTRTVFGIAFEPRLEVVGIKAF